MIISVDAAKSFGKMPYPLNNESIQQIISGKEGLN